MDRPYQPFYWEDYEEVEERDFLSNNEDVEVVPTDQISHFCNVEDYQSLLCKCLSALELKDPSVWGGHPAGP